eukprot:gnl/Dysnectes_brevis/195_a224_5753.p1 GENE.gnl/Dysnectes_brevis/195_a224_5753~~gnl/Dysnectes_brevis/195_a224_5753.p1  ORF type:complete len:603 (-),score=172.65 gnl/Dysnectes_brevis/195_a224_5753:56-1828(-)
MSSEKAILANSLAKEWLTLDRDPETIKEVHDRLENEDYDHLIKVLSSRMAFGTAGLRGTLGAGYACMNELTVTQAAQGLYNYLVATVPDLKERGIVIGHDARRKSLEFSELTAATFAVHGVKVYLFPPFAPTPYVPFGVSFFNAAAGVMVTASHNPSTDNGYKVYWGNGVQITPPHDTNIQNTIMESLIPFPETANRKQVLDNARATGLLVDPRDLGVLEAYDKVTLPVHFNDDEANRTSPVKFGYSAMWGVGYEPVVRALKVFGFDPDSWFMVPGEVDPNPTFGGCPKPNPEERHNMERACKVAEASGTQVVFANDPDADRLAMAEHTAEGWRYFHGNEIGALLADWLYTNWSARHPEEPIMMLNSTVSSKFIQSMAKAHGFEYEETLTGFKWLGKCSISAKARGVKPLFAFEEAIGYVTGGHVGDKDGVSALAVAAEMVVSLYASGTTLSQHLFALGERYGHFKFCNGAVMVDNQAQVTALFQGLLHGGDGFGRGYTTQFGRFTVHRVRDLQAPGFDSGTEDKMPVLPVSSSPMVTFHMNDGVVCTLRPSGTEPKVKYYIEARGDSPENAQELANEFAEAFKKVFLSK